MASEGRKRVRNVQQSRALVFSRGIDPSVACLSRMALVLWWLGYPDMALARSHEAIALAQRLAHPYSLCFALLYGAHLHGWRREASSAEELSRAVLSLTHEHGFAQFLGGGMMRLGWALVEQGAVPEGLAQIQQGLTVDKTYRIELGRHETLSILAQAYGKAGQAQTGLRLVDEALTVVHRNGELYGESELYRIKGELFLQAARHSLESNGETRHDTLHMLYAEEIEACLHQAIDLARKQLAKSFELRAVMSLSRLWQQQGKQTAACQMLTEIYNWFTEGFNTSDLQDTKALLTALKGQ